MFLIKDTTNDRILEKRDFAAEKEYPFLSYREAAVNCNELNICSFGLPTYNICFEDGVIVTAAIEKYILSMEENIYEIFNIIKINNPIPN